MRMLFFPISNLKRLRTNKSRRVVLSRIPVYSGIRKLILWFPYSFHIRCTILSTVYFYTLLSMFPFLFNWSLLKAGAVQSSDLSLFCTRSTIGQLNEQDAIEQYAIDEYEEQYISCNKIYILHFQIDNLLYEIFFEAGVLKRYTD